VTACRRFKCAYCGHIYDEAEGDPTEGIPPGTRFEDLPDDWICPECGAFKFDFALIED
jgi:rubredoxin-NAD+ reductase